MANFEFNPFDDATRRNPFALYAEARREHPVYPHAGLPITSVFRYADVQAILKDAATWSSRFPPPPGVDPADMPEPSMLGQDPPQHDRLRSLVNQAFTPRIVKRLEPRMIEIADELMDAALEAGEVDFVQALTYPLPVIVIAEIIGVPASDRAQFKEWSDRTVANLGTGLFVPPSADHMRELGKLLKTMEDYFAGLAEERRREPKEDLLTGLVQATHEGSKMTPEEMVRMLVLLLVAGNETTTTLIGNTVLELLAHPEATAELRRDASLIPAAVEEVLRFSSPVQLDPRRATRDIELHGHTVKENQLVVCWIGSANHDEEMFEAPETFNIHREDNRHLAFGFGPHYCIGSNLARIETQVALRALLAKTKSFGRTNSEPLPLHQSIVFRGYTSLPLRLQAA